MSIKKGREYIPVSSSLRNDSGNSSGDRRNSAFGRIESWLRSAGKSQIAGVGIFLIVVVIFFGVFAPHFISLQNMRNILFSATVLALAALGESLVLLTGNYDLSVGSIVGLTAFLAYDWCSHSQSLGAFVVVVGVLIGAILGAFNGLLVGYLKIPSMVATLGTLSVYRGLCSWYAGPREVTKNQIPGWMNSFAPSSFVGIPSFVWIVVIICIAATFILNFRPIGRELYAYGSNHVASESFGLNSRLILFGAYMGSGALAGLVGIFMGAQVGTINSVMGNGYEMEVIAAAVIGGVSLWGGVGTPVGAMLGALAYACLDNGLVLLGVNEYFRLIFQGTAVIVAVGIDALVRKQSSRFSVRRSILEVK